MNEDFFVGFFFNNFTKRPPNVFEFVFWRGPYLTAETYI